MKHRAAHSKERHWRAPGHAGDRCVHRQLSRNLLAIAGYGPPPAPGSEVSHDQQNPDGDAGTDAKREHQRTDTDDTPEVPADCDDRDLERYANRGDRKAADPLQSVIRPSLGPGPRLAVR